MSVIYFLISISVVVAGIFLYLFIKSVKSGQFDDAYTPSVRMLFDDELKEDSSNNSHKTKNEKNLTKVK
ncbi:cbb3-type cytochrome oxidase assembly protein CcoS [Myroides injenensis]|uniref:cbb3-type cytochrome oxidase assembly protein CcoS n=1 Tax=Myroides injenensis TaxID=1183151 RepID=UPI002270FF3B|nr:cbb3-type cytochrome oxidase assembly protein CcoS [Myroides injenensis]